MTLQAHRLMSRRQRSFQRRHALAIAAAAALGPFAAAPASAAVCTWDTTNGNWNAIVNWLGCVGGNGNPANTPGSNDTANIGSSGVVTIDTAQSILNLNNAGQINIDAASLTLFNGGSTVNTGVINVGSATTAALQVSAGHNINNTGGVINVADGSVVNQFGSTISGGTINTTGSGAVVAGNSGNNFLDNLTLNGTLDIANAYGIERVTNGLTLNGSVNIAKGSIFAPQGDQTFSGNGTIVFADSNATNRFNVEAGNLTLASGMTVRGDTGYIGQQAYVVGAATLTNNGTIQADVAGGTIRLAVNGTTVNNGTLAALNGGTLRIENNVNGAGGGQILAGAGSVVSQAGVTLSGGTINSNGGGSLRAENNGNNFLDNLTLNGTLDMASAYGVERVTNGLVLNGSVNIAKGSIFAPQGDQTISGSGTIVFADSNASNRLNVEAGNLTLGSGITLRGETGYIGQQAWVVGAATLTNNGTIQADVAGGTISLGVNGLTTNNGTLAALNGGTLRLRSDVAGTASGQILAGAGSIVSQAGVTLSGTINANGGGSLRAENYSNNFLDNVTLNGTLDLASAYGVERVTNGLVLNGSINIGDGSIFAPQGDQTIGGNGTIVFADGNANNRLNVEAGNLTLGSGITLRGETGYIGQQAWVVGAATLTNNGTIQADVAGGTISLGVNGLTTNNGTLAALNGGTLRLRSDVAGTASGQILAGAGSIVSQAGVTLSGTINANGGGSLRAENNGSNFLDNVTLNGTLDLASAYGVERVTNGLVLNGSINIGDGSIFAPQGDQTIGGNGTIVFADSNATNRFNVEAGNLTLASGMTVRGDTGYIGQQAYVVGAATLTNNGTIQADVAGGTIRLTVNGTTVNNGTLAAFNGGTLRIENNVNGAGGGQILAGAGSVVSQAGVTLSGGTINSNGDGNLRAENYSNNFLDNVTLNGTLDMASAYGVERVTNGLTLNGSVNIAKGSIFAPQGDQTIGGSGTIVFADGNASNRFNVEAGNLTLGSGITVRGQTGYIGQQAWAGGAATLTNNGTINSDGGGTITVAVNGTTTNAGMMRAQDGTLAINTALVNHGTLQADADGVVKLPNGFTNDGLMTGVGKFTLATGTLTNNGHVTPGMPGGDPGALTLDGKYAQGASGWFDVGLDGASFGSLSISGSAALDGTISVICQGACDYAAGTSWIVMMTGGSNLVTGTFAGPVVMTGFSAGAFSVTYLSNQVILNVTEATVGVVPEPSTYAMTLAGLAALGWLARRRRTA